VSSSAVGVDPTPAAGALMQTAVTTAARELDAVFFGEALAGTAGSSGSPPSGLTVAESIRNQEVPTAGAPLALGLSIGRACGRHA
jgi:hypothetical protein